MLFEHIQEDNLPELRRALGIGTLGIRLNAPGAFLPDSGLNPSCFDSEWQRWLEHKNHEISQTMAGAAIALTQLKWDAFDQVERIWNNSLIAKESSRSLQAGRQALTATDGALHRGLVSLLASHTLKKSGRGHLVTIMVAHTLHYHLPLVNAPLIYLYLEWSAARRACFDSSEIDYSVESFFSATPRLDVLSRQTITAFNQTLLFREVA